MAKDNKDYFKLVRRFVDNELSPLESAEMKEAISADTSLKAKVDEIRLLYDKVSRVFFHFCPPEKLVERVIKGLPDSKRLLDVPKFGEIAIALELAEKPQVDIALAEQIELRMKGMDELLGIILQKNNVLTEEQISKIIEVQGEQGKPQVLGGCEILEQVGRGGMGVVYRARQVSLGRDVAIKVLYPKLANDANFVQSFITEGHAVAQLAHPNVVTGIDVGEQEGYIYLIMEFVDGPTLRQWLKKNDAKPESETIDIAIQISSALEYAHNLNFVHRDIKPDNIMLDKSGAAKLCDLGLVKSGGEDLLTKKGEVIGTPHYLSPEQATGESDLDIRSDIYSLGATLYHVLTGTTPYSGKSSQEIMEKHAFSDIEEPQKRSPKLSDELNAIVCKMMARDKDKRYPTPSDLNRDLELLKADRMPLALQEKLIKEGKLNPNSLIYRDKGPQRVAMVVLIAAVIIIAGVFAFSKLAPKPIETATRTPSPSIKISKKPKTTLKPIKFAYDVKKAQLDFKRVLDLQEAQPENLLEIISASSHVCTKYPGTEQAVKSAIILEEARETLENQSVSKLAELKAKAEGYIANGEYRNAVQVFQGFPDKYIFTKAYLKVNPTIEELKETISYIIVEKIAQAEKLAESNEFGKSEDILRKLLKKVPGELTLDIYNELTNLVIMRDLYVRKEGALAVTRILDFSLDGYFEEADKLVNRYTTDRIFSEYAREVNDACFFLASIKRVISTATQKLAKLEGKRTSILYAGQLDQVTIKISKVLDNNFYKIVELGDKKEEKTIHISDISPLTIASFTRDLLKKAKKDEKALGIIDIAIYEFFSGRFYEANRDAQEAKNLGHDLAAYESLKEDFKEVVINRFALKVFEQMATAAEEDRWKDVGALANKLLDEYKTSNLVKARTKIISKYMTQASISTSGITDLFKGKMSVDDDGNLIFDYDSFSEKQLEDFSYDSNIWKSNKGVLEGSPDPEYSHGIHHSAVFKSYLKVEMDYMNISPNSVCARLGSWWFGINSHNSKAGIADTIKINKGWESFDVKDTGFAFRKNTYYRLVFICEGNTGSIFVNGKLILSAQILNAPSCFELRNLGNAKIKSLRISGKPDPAWMKTIGSLLEKVKDGKLSRGLMRTAYSDIYFGRRSSKARVPSIGDHFVVGPTKNFKKPVYSVKYEGQLLVLEDGEYEFMLSTSARTRLRIDGVDLLDNLTSDEVPDDTIFVKVKLTAGLHQLELFVSNDGIEHQIIRLEYNSGTGSFGDIPALLFFSDTK